MFGYVKRSKYDRVVDELDALKVACADMKRMQAADKAAREELQRGREALEHEITVLAKTIVQLSDRNRILQKQRDELLAYKQNQQRGLRNHKPIEMRVN